MKIRRGVPGFGCVAAVALTVVLGFALPAPCQTTNLPPPQSPPDHTFLIAFGNSQSYRGINVPSPDIQGHYWNSVGSTAFNSPLTNAAGQATKSGLVFDIDGGNDFYNGPAGTNQNPTYCVIDTNALGYLGIKEGVYHFYVSSKFEIINMDPAKTYSLIFFGSHSYNNPRSNGVATTYSLYTDRTYTTPVTSVSLNVEDPVNIAAYNSNTVATISGVSPQPDGVFYIRFDATDGTRYSGYLNCMQVVDLSTNTPPTTTPPPVNRTVLIKMGDSASYRGINATSPDVQGHYWNCVDNSQYFPVLTNAAGAPTAWAFGFDASETNDPYFVAGATDYFNGPAETTNTVPPQPIQDPAYCVIDTNALGYLGVKEAVFNYYVNARFQIQGLDPAKSYSLTFFGSHQYCDQDDPVTVYSVYGDTNYTTVAASASLYVGAPNYAFWNQNNVAVISPISPQPNGILYIGFIGADGSQGFLNCLQIVDLTPTSPSDPFTVWQSHYFTGSPLNSSPNADPLGKGFSNTNQFLAGFNPTNSAAYPHIISLARSNPTNLVITYLGASGDSTWTPGFASRTNVLEYTTGAANGSYLSNFVSTGQTNVLSGGTGLGTVASFIQTNGVTGPTRYYRVRVLVP